MGSRDSQDKGLGGDKKGEVVDGDLSLGIVVERTRRAVVGCG